MMKNLFLTFALLGSSAMLSAQATIKIPKVYQPVKKSMYHKGWIDFNKNGVMDVYENPNAKIEDRIEDLRTNEYRREDLPNGDALRL